MKKVIILLLLLAVYLGGIFLVIRFYPFLFSKNIYGKVEAIERVESGAAILTTRSGQIPSQAFSFAIAIRQDSSGEIFTGSSEDRQWATIEKDHCVEARFFPYPPWNLEKSGTYHNVRLEKRFDCK